MLRIEKLCKSYRKTMALNGLDLYVKRGEIFGLVGKNGAGKTTVMKIAAGLLPADSGQVVVNGYDPGRDTAEARSSIGYMPDFFGVYNQLEVMEYMKFYASIYGIRGETAVKRSMELLELTGLQDKMKQDVDHLSRGMKQRLCLARALLHDPTLLLLDEPASGLDPEARHEMKALISSLGRVGKTILISSHILPELYEMCTTIGIVDKGQMVLIRETEILREELKYSGCYSVSVKSGMRRMKELLHQQTGIEDIRDEGRTLRFRMAGGEEEAAALLRTVIEAGIGVYEFRQEAGDLESLFLSLTRKEGEQDDIS